MWWTDRFVGYDCEFYKSYRFYKVNARLDLITNAASPVIILHRVINWKFRCIETKKIAKLILEEISILIEKFKKETLKNTVVLKNSLLLMT